MGWTPGRAGQAGWAGWYGLAVVGLVVAVVACVQISSAPTAAPSGTTSADIGSSASPSDGASPSPSPSRRPKKSPRPRTPQPSTEPTLSATPSTEPTATDTATPEPPTSAPTDTPHSSFHFPFSFPLASFIIQPLEPKFDYQASANYGEANLSAGFSPDPYSVGMTTGGPVDASYLGSSCSGFGTVAPDLRVNFGGGGASLLRLYFVGSNGDATMIVNDPYGNYYCVDDSFGTVNPTLDFNNPAGGTYDIWIGSSVSGTTVSGTLYLTENSGNHP